jgi:hypothetical protein
VNRSLGCLEERAWYQKLTLPIFLFLPVFHQGNCALGKVKIRPFRYYWSGSQLMLNPGDPKPHYVPHDKLGLSQAYPMMTAIAAAVPDVVLLPD